MVAPASVPNTRGQSVDTIYDSTGAGYIKLAVGLVGTTTDADAAWQGVATHMDGDAFNASDGIVVVGGVDETDGTTPRKMAVSALGELIALLRPTGSACTDASGTITTGATAQDILASNLDRRYMLVINEDDAEDLWIDFGVTAVADQPSVRLQPHQSFVMEGSVVFTERVSAIAATTGHKFVAKEA